MQVHIKTNSGLRTTNGDELARRAHVQRIEFDNSAYVDFTEYRAFVQGQGLHGLQVGDSNNVVLISGGRKAIQREFRDYPLLLTPAPGQSLVMLALQYRPTHDVSFGRILINAPSIGVAQAQARAPQAGAFELLQRAAKGTKAIVEAAARQEKKFTFVQIYSGPAVPGDLLVNNGNNAVNTHAIGVQLQNHYTWPAI